MGIEWEFNPFSAASRAARAERAGRIGEALRLYARAEQHQRLLECLRYCLPAWPVRASLLSAAQEIHELYASTGVARGAGVPAAVTTRLAEEARSAADVLWHSADRVAAAGAQKVQSPALQQGLKREAEKVARVLEAIREARRGLAELTLHGGASSAELEAEERRLRALAEATRSLKETMDEAPA